MKITKVCLAEKFAQFGETWSPKIVGELNDSYVKLVKLEGEFVWHHHELEDELFLVVNGELQMGLRDDDGERVEERAGEFIIVPRGIEHRPVAGDGTQVVLVEPKITVNTGSSPGERTREAVRL